MNGLIPQKQQADYSRFLFAVKSGYISTAQRTLLKITDPTLRDCAVTGMVAHVYGQSGFHEGWGL